MYQFQNWKQVAALVRGTLPPRRVLEINLLDISFHPSRVPGFISDFGLPPGANGDWRLPFADGSGLHVQDNGHGRLSIHWDEIDPTCGLDRRIRHGARDAPGTFLIFAMSVGAAVASCAGGRSRATVGAGVGLLVGLAMVATSD